MLEELLKNAALQLGITGEEIDCWRCKIEQEINDDLGADHRPIRQRQLGSPTRSSTPIDQQITSGEQHYWRIWKEALPQLKLVVPILLALTEQKLRIDALNAARRRQREQTLTAAGMKSGYIRLCDALKLNGATHTKAAQLKEEKMAIHSDLICWKEYDPRFLDHSNPWLGIHALYAERTLQKVGADGRPPRRSSPGRPPIKRNMPTSFDYWRFGENEDDSYPTVDLTKPDEVTVPSAEQSGEAQQAISVFAAVAEKLRHGTSSTSTSTSAMTSETGMPNAPASSAATQKTNDEGDVGNTVASNPTPSAPANPERPAAAPVYRSGGFGSLMSAPPNNKAPDR